MAIHPVSVCEQRIRQMTADETTRHQDLHAAISLLR